LIVKWSTLKEITSNYFKIQPDFLIKKFWLYRYKLVIELMRLMIYLR
jgi:hypothetical protein